MKMTALLYPISFLVVLSLVVIIHEFGHFQAARSCGVKVDEFSVGFGKTLWSRTDKKGTLWKVCLIPLGGYVKMLGDADAAGTKVDEKVNTLTDEEKAQVETTLADLQAECYEVYNQLKADPDNATAISAAAAQKVHEACVALVNAVK